MKGRLAIRLAVFICVCASMFGCKLPKFRNDAGSGPTAALSETYRGKGSLVTVHYPSDFAAKTEPSSKPGATTVVLTRVLSGGLDETIAIGTIATPITTELPEFVRVVHKEIVARYDRNDKYVEVKRDDNVSMADTIATCIEGELTVALATKYLTSSCYFIRDGHAYIVASTWPKSRATDSTLLKRIINATEYHDVDPEAKAEAAKAATAPLSQARTSLQGFVQAHFPSDFVFDQAEGETGVAISRANEVVWVDAVEPPISYDLRDFTRAARAGDKGRYADAKDIVTEPKAEWEGTPAVYVASEIRSTVGGMLFVQHAWYMIKDRRGVIVSITYPKAQPDEFRVLDRIARATVFAKRGKRLKPTADEFAAPIDEEF